MPIRRSPNGAGYSPSTAWSRSPGLGGRNQSERLVAINRNRWSQSAGTPNLAQRQDARLAALSAATCLARLWSARGETEPAQRIVSEQLEGLASAKGAARLPVVQAARAALEALRNPSGRRECVS